MDRKLIKADLELLVAHWEAVVSRVLQGKVVTYQSFSLSSFKDGRLIGQDRYGNTLLVTEEGMILYPTGLVW